MNDSHNLNVLLCSKLLKDEHLKLVDVRTPGEYRLVHIAGAINIDFYAKDFEKKLEQLDKHEKYLIHCASGGRSTETVLLMRRLGFKHVYHMAGGIKAWIAENLPVKH